jgi:hypothetical protein
MTGILHAIAAAVSGTIVPNPTPWSVSYSVPTGVGNTVAAQLFVNETGSTSQTGLGTPTLTQGSDWISPATQIAPNYWVRATLTAGTAPDIGTLNTWQKISGNLGWGWSNSTAAGTRSCTLTLEISPFSSGANVVWTTTGNLVRAIHA